MLGDMGHSPANETNHLQESLGAVCRDIVRRQVAVCLAVWLAVTVPVTCDHHLVMTLADSMDSSSPQHDHPAESAMAEHSMDTGHTASESPCSIGQHDAAQSIMTVLTLFTGVQPAAIRFQSPERLSALVSISALASPLTALPPPVPPPRSIQS
jgi:hypothetical protein